MKSKKGAALATILVLMFVMLAFILGLAWVIDKNLQFASKESRKTTGLQLARSAVEYGIYDTTNANIIDVRPTNAFWVQRTNDLYSSAEMEVYSTEAGADRDPYYIQIQVTNPNDNNSGTYRFIGIVKNRLGGNEIARKVLVANKPIDLTPAHDIFVLKKIREE